MWLDIYKVKRKIRLFASLYTVLKKHDSILLEKKVFNSQKYTYMRTNFFNFLQFQEPIPARVYNSKKTETNTLQRSPHYTKNTAIFKYTREDHQLKKISKEFNEKFYMANNNKDFFMPFYLNNYSYTVLRFTDFMKNIRLPYYLIFDIIDRQSEKGTLALEILQDISDKAYNFTTLYQNSLTSLTMKQVIKSKPVLKNDTTNRVEEIISFFNSFPFFLYYPNKRFFSLKRRKTFKFFDKPFFFLHDKNFYQLSKFIRKRRKKLKNFIF